MCWHSQPRPVPARLGTFTLSYHNVMRCRPQVGETRFSRNSPARGSHSGHFAGQKRRSGATAAEGLFPHRGHFCGPGGTGIRPAVVAPRPTLCASIWAPKRPAAVRRNSLPSKVLRGETPSSFSQKDFMRYAGSSQSHPLLVKNSHNRWGNGVNFLWPPDSPRGRA